MPKHLRQPNAVIYAVARRADDFADEGDLSNEERIAALTDFSEKLDLIEEGKDVEDDLKNIIIELNKNEISPLVGMQKFANSTAKSIGNGLGNVTSVLGKSLGGASPAGTYDSGVTYNSGSSDSVAEMMKAQRNMYNDYNKNIRKGIEEKNRSYSSSQATPAGSYYSSNNNHSQINKEKRAAESRKLKQEKTQREREKRQRAIKEEKRRKERREGRREGGKERKKEKEREREGEREREREREKKKREREREKERGGSSELTCGSPFQRERRRKKRKRKPRRRKRRNQTQATKREVHIKKHA